MDEQDEDLSQSTFEGQNNLIHLILFKKGAKSQYYERCGVEINNHKIYVSPHGHDANRIKKTIDDNVIGFKNVICFFVRINGFALIFDHKRHCKHFFNILEQKKVESGNSQLTLASFEKRFIVPMIEELKDYTELDFDFRMFVLQFLKSLDGEQKQRLAPVLIATKIEQCLLDSVLKGIELPVNIEEETKKKPKVVSRSRSSDEEKKKINQQPQFCGSFNQTPGPELVTQAALFEKESIEQRPKFCSSLPSASNVAFNPEESTKDNSEIRFPPARKKPRLSTSSSSSRNLLEPITSPFQVIEYTQSGVTKTHLFIFITEERTECYEYHLAARSKKFICIGKHCRKSGPVLHKDSNGNDRLYFKGLRCSCESRLFDPDRYKNDINVFQPNYWIAEEEFRGRNGIRKGLKLYVYATEDKKKAYKFYLDEKLNRFLCARCSTKNFSLRACTLKNADGLDFIAIQDKKHKCEPYDC